MPAVPRSRLLPLNEYLGWTPYAWLIYLPILFVDPAIQGTPLTWTATIAGTVVFLATYFRGYRVQGRQLLFVVMAESALAIALSPINSGAYVLFVYAASFAAQLADTRHAVRAVVAIWLAGFATAWGVDAPIYYWLGHGVFTPFIAGVNLHFARVNRANAKLRLAQEEIEHLAAVAERERIARDLHDLLGHTLSLIVLKSELASKLAERDPPRAVQEIRDVEQVARTALREVRDALRGYRPTLAGELTRAQAFLEAARIRAELDVADVPLAHAGEAVIALALREAVTNVVRHSGASRARIRVWRDNGRAVLEVTDDGRGAPNAEGAGLRGMRERVEAIGGRVSREYDNGMRLMVTLPLGEPA